MCVCVRARASVCVGWVGRCFLKVNHYLICLLTGLSLTLSEDDITVNKNAEGLIKYY